jgi:hypothetical protein
VPEDGHSDARVNIERGEQQPAGTADAAPGAPDIESRLMLRGSIGWPVRVVKTSAYFSPQMQVSGQVWPGVVAGPGTGPHWEPAATNARAGERASGQRKPSAEDRDKAAVAMMRHCG